MSVKHLTCLGSAALWQELGQDGDMLPIKSAVFPYWCRLPKCIEVHRECYSSSCGLVKSLCGTQISEEVAVSWFSLKRYTVWVMPGVRQGKERFPRTDLFSPCFCKVNSTSPPTLLLM